MGEPGTKELISLEELQVAGGLRTGRKHVLSILVENKPGVLTRIAGLFARRGFNIDTLAVGPTDDDEVSRITLTVDGAKHPIDQVTKQLHKLVNVLKIRDLEPEEAVSRELALFKVSADGGQRGEVMQITDIFRGKVVDVGKRSIVIEITGTDDKIAAFEQLVRPFGLIEMVRTGEIAISRGRGERWFCLEQPDRQGFALAALGAVRTLEARGPDRFAQVAATWRGLAADALADPAAGPRGAGLVAVGGFSFAVDGGSAPHWAGFAPASLVVPEVALARCDGVTWLTLAAAVAPDDTTEDRLAALDRRLGELRAVPLPLLDPAPAERARVAGAMPPQHYVSAVARAVERIRAGELEKVVLAREVEVHAPAAHDPGAILGVLREAFPECFVFAAGVGDAAFVAASPELLVRREGQRASTLALAGSTRRSADPAVDDHLGEQLLRSAKDREEQAIVARRIQRTLRSHAVWVAASPEPVLVRMANIQHLATPALGSCATRIPRPSWPRPRSSSRRCCRCSRADPQASAAATSAHTRRCNATFAVRSVRTSTIDVPSASSARVSAASKPGASVTSWCSAPKRLAARAKSSPCGVATCSSNTSDSPAMGRKWKMPPPSLLSRTIARGSPSRGPASRPPRSCTRATSPIRSTVGPCPAAAAP